MLTLQTATGMQWRVRWGVCQWGRSLDSVRFVWKSLWLRCKSYLFPECMLVLVSVQIWLLLLVVRFIVVMSVCYLSSEFSFVFNELVPRLKFLNSRYYSSDSLDSCQLQSSFEVLWAAAARLGLPAAWDSDRQDHWPGGHNLECRGASLWQKYGVCKLVNISCALPHFTFHLFCFFCIYIWRKLFIWHGWFYKCRSCYMRWAQLACSATLNAPWFIYTWQSNCSTALQIVVLAKIKGLFVH